MSTKFSERVPEDAPDLPKKQVSLAQLPTLSLKSQVETTSWLIEFSGS